MYIYILHVCNPLVVYTQTSNHKNYFETSLTQTLKVSSWYDLCIIPQEISACIIVLLNLGCICKKTGSNNCYLYIIILNLIIFCFIFLCLKFILALLQGEQKVFQWFKKLNVLKLLQSKVRLLNFACICICFGNCHILKLFEERKRNKWQA